MLTHHYEYARSLSNIGNAEQRDGTSFPVIIRRIPNTNLFDGMLPWPYILLKNSSEIEGLIAAYPNLVSIVGNISPCTKVYWENDSGNFIHPYKDHFVYDPTLPLELSAKTRRNIKIGKKENSFSISHVDEVLTDDIVRLYAEFLARKRMDGDFFKFNSSHFDFLKNSKDSSMFICRDSKLCLSAIALGFISDSGLHLLHIIIGDAGLNHKSGYVLMSGIVDYAKHKMIQIFFGGLPQIKESGLHTFKKRWSNKILKSSILKLTIQHQNFIELSGENITNNFYPQYRVIHR